MYTESLDMVVMKKINIITAATYCCIAFYQNRERLALVIGPFNPGEFVSLMLENLSNCYYPLRNKHDDRQRVCGTQEISSAGYSSLMTVKRK
jgi:hypothetical protein